MRALPILLLAVFVGATFTWPLSDTDLWWHLSAGREMIDRLAWLRADPFCLSSLGTAWTDLHWGFQLLVFALHRAGGETVLVGARALLVGATAALALRGRLSWDTLVVAGLVLAGSRLFLDLRPLLVTLLCLAALWTFSLERRLGLRSVAVGLLAQVALVNTQGLFLLGPLFALISAAGHLGEGDPDGARGRAWLAAGLVGVSVVNPWGFDAFSLAVRVANRILPGGDAVFAREIPENAALWTWLREAPLRALPWIWALVVSTFLFRRGPGSLGRGLLIACCAALSLLAVRNLPLLALAVLLSIGPRTWPLPRAPAIGAPLLLGLLALPSLLERRWNLRGVAVAPAHFPGPAALAVLARAPSPVFHELRIGGWLSWNLPSRNVCWADTRLVLHDAAFVRAYLDVLDDPSRFQAWSDRQGFRLAAIPVVAWPRFHGLLVHLLRSERWRLVDGDGAWALFALADPDAGTPPALPGMDTASIERALHARFGSNPPLEAFVRGRWTAVLREAGR